MTARRTPLDTILSSQRGSTFGRVLLIILGSILILSGLILSIATFGITLEGDASILILLPFALSSIAGGIYIIVTQARNMKAIEPTSGKARAARIEAGDGDDRIVSSVPLTETPTFPHTPTPEPSASASGEAPKDDITQLVFRSSDLFATLRDLDDEKMDVIFSEVVPPEGVGLAVMNRLGRAAAFRTVQAEDVL